MHILLIEITLTGHHSIYLEQIAEAHLELRRTVTIVVSEKFKTNPVINRLRESYGDSLRVVPLSETECTKAMNSRWGDTGRELGLWRIFQKAFRLVSVEHPVDFVFLPYVDYCLNAIGLLGSPFDKVAWGGLCMRPAFHYKACGVIAPNSILLYLKRFLFNRILGLNNLACLFSNDELLVSYIRNNRPSIAQRLRYLPDPAELPLNFDTSELRKKYNVPVDSKVVLLYGAIDGRKGIFHLLDSLESSTELSEWHVLIVGRQAATVREALSGQRWSGLKQAKRTHVIDEFVSDEVEHHVFALCDVVWVAYAGHYTMSGVLVRAGMYSKPVIACEDGLIGWYARTKKLGLVVSGSRESIVSAIIYLSKKPNASTIGENGWYQFKGNTWSSFIELII